MARATQQRKLETRSRLIAAANEIIEEVGFAALRIEEVVLRAGTAKGTFFAHFSDKDALMELVVAERMDRHLDALADTTAPGSVEEMISVLRPLCDFATSERYLFDLIMRHSGVAVEGEAGPISLTFLRMAEVLQDWLSARPYRDDISAVLQAEGVQAFLLHSMAEQFCATNNDRSFQSQLLQLLNAWLLPSGKAPASAH